MSKKCVKCGHTLPDDASFCPHCTTVQTEKQEIKTPRRWKRAALTVIGILILIAVIGVAVSMYHRPKAYEGGAQIDYADKDKTYKVLLTFSEGDGVTGMHRENVQIHWRKVWTVLCRVSCMFSIRIRENWHGKSFQKKWNPAG